MANETSEQVEAKRDLNKGMERIGGRLFYAGIDLPEGPWQSEPDHAEFEAHGMACIIHRGPLGAWCGYVAVPPGHPWHGKESGAITDPYPEVHGGLTYSRKCQGSICHVPKPGESDDVWWLGFDCAHLYDLSPGAFAITPPRYRSDGEAYRTAAYVQRETERLAAQARAADGGLVEGEQLPLTDPVFDKLFNTPQVRS